MNPKIEDSWKNLLKDEFNSDYFKELKSFLQEEKRNNTIFPKGKDIFSAFNLTPFDKVKVVILGQDPYHGEGQAHGLAFSVPEGIQIPPSLRNIYKELNNDLELPIPKQGSLISWAKQGILLMNATLTVRAHQAGSHQNKGWETFTDSIIRLINQEKENVVFILWGNYAKQKQKLIDNQKHHIITCVHPSPLSAHRGFFGSKPFSKTNNYFKEHGIQQINWEL
ncbi:MAG: uracil-DNA glycosylase [Bacteroidales bacterium]